MLMRLLLPGVLLVIGAFVLRARVFRWWNVLCWLAWAIGLGLIGVALDSFFFGGFPVFVPTLTVTAALSAHPLFLKARKYA